jgi:hypothetical protein
MDSLRDYTCNLIMMSHIRTQNGTGPAVAALDDIVIVGNKLAITCWTANLVVLLPSNPLRCSASFAMLPWPIPTELTLQVISYLERRDQLPFSLVSHACRELVLPLLFSDVQFNEHSRLKSQKLKEALEIFNGAGQNVKNTIKYSRGNLLWAESWHSTFTLTEH